MTLVWMPATALEGEVLALTLTCHLGEAVSIDMLLDCRDGREGGSEVLGGVWRLPGG